MFEKFIRGLRAMELEERILHIGVLICLSGLFVPWLTRQWGGGTEIWNGFGSFTGFIGHFVLVLQFFILSVTLSPLLGGPVIVRRIQRHVVRLMTSAGCLLLLVAAFTVLLRLTSQTTGSELRFGIYVALVGSALTTLYSFLQYQEQRKSEVQQLFHHPDEQKPAAKLSAAESAPQDRPPPPPPPPPLSAEDHNLFQSS